ncbi:MAG: TldD/PmbA family protein [Candidatus Thermoplasmatota archaeon]|nr:TldD/PmbA family protein [Candidatus Thermoplasmatota archaeon]MBS3790504.1 TldD/PmbA family protein [Candidatus Thermoplasmatota archaeon]
MNGKLVESVKKALELIDKKNLAGDVFGVKERNISYSIKKGELSESSEYEDLGLGIRIIKDGKIGFGYCTPGKEEKGVRRAEELSNISQKLDLGLPEEEDIPEPEIFDEKVEDSSLEGEGAEFTQQVIDGAKDLKDDIIPTRGSLSISVGSKVIGNTHGVFLKQRNTAVSTGVLATIPGDETSINAGESRFSRRMDLDFADIGKTAAEKVDSLREKSELPKGEIPIVMNPDAFGMLMWFGIVPAINGENIRKGKSVYEGRKGEKVASEELLMKDDPTMDWGIGSSPFDDEGVPSRTVSIIEDGILARFIYDLKEAIKSNTESTGNGMRGGFKNPPDISDRNIVLRGEGKKKDELLPDQGILVDGVMGAHTLNPASGDFSVVGTPAWLVENGEIKGKVEGAMISGNLPEVLESIELADDYKKSHASIGSRDIKMDLPSARFNDVTVSGK